VEEDSNRNDTKELLRERLVKLRGLTCYSEQHDLIYSVCRETHEARHEVQERNPGRKQQADHNGIHQHPVPSTEKKVWAHHRFVEVRLHQWQGHTRLNTAHQRPRHHRYRWHYHIGGDGKGELRAHYSVPIHAEIVVGPAKHEPLEGVLSALAQVSVDEQCH
jgi:hypothetical protein